MSHDDLTHSNIPNKELLISHLNLRKILGWTGILFPLILVIGSMNLSQCLDIQHSISHYYHTIMGDLFVGVLFAMAIFLFTYKGYDKRDRFYCRLASIAAIGVALFPTDAKTNWWDLAGENSLDIEGILAAYGDCSYPGHIQSSFIGDIHLFCAAVFFVSLAYISFYLFTKTGKGKEEKMTGQKLKRNRVYRVCACIMFVCILAIAIYFLAKKHAGVQMLALSKLKPVFFLESIALMAFGISWLTKGEGIFSDIVEKEKKVPAA